MTDIAEADRSVAVVLGSGGARGYAHIGALQVIEEAGFEVTAISGCSMGALVGGLYAAGRLDDYVDWVTGLRQLDILRLVDISLSAGGAIRGEKVIAVVRDMLGDLLIEDLPLDYTAVATDLLSHREVWFQSGLLTDAIRASIAIPSLFTPVVSGNQLLVDGALMNPVPILPTLSTSASLTIAVHLSGETRRHSPIRPTGPLPAVDLDDEDDAPIDGDPEPESLRERASRFLDWESVKAMMRRDTAKDGATVEEDPAADVGRLDIVNLAYEVMQSTLTSYKLAGYPPDVLVEIPKSAARTFEFHRAGELIELGRERTAAALAEAGLHHT